jgi:hypothetical protein
MVNRYRFGEQLEMSQGVSENKSIGTILLSNIPGALNTYPAHEANDRNGTDWWVEREMGRWLSVDCKVREEDWSIKRTPKDDLALETWSVVEQNIPGWTRDSKKQTDYVLWLWKDTGRWCLVPFVMLCAVFQENWMDWKKQYQTDRQYTTRHNGASYHSECVFVPRRVVWATIYRRFSGQPVVERGVW